jgi:hypothetical protein
MFCPYRYLCEQVQSYIKSCKMKEDCKRKEGFIKHKIPQQPVLPFPTKETDHEQR